MRSILLLLLLLLATPALASDGVLEINQTCAVETGCFPGDTAAYPVTIATPGSYRLTSDLIVPDENTDGIRISTSDVGIDLNNFAIIRSGCEGATIDCTPASGDGSGVERTSSSNRGVSVKNGSITGMGNYGVLLGAQAEVTNLRVRWNRFVGISAGTGSTVSGSTAYQNGSFGILASAGSTISGNTAYQNGGDGISANTGSTVSGNTTHLNTGNGISVSTGSTVSGNTTFRNSGNGISGSSGSIISDNASYDNTLNGIAASNGCTIRGNSVRANDEWGLDISSPTSAYRENTISTLGVALGTVDGGTDAGGNVCNGSLACP